MAVKIGEWIKVEYTGTLDDGTIFDGTGVDCGNPLKFQVGSGQLVKGFDESVQGKTLGEEYTIRLEPSEAYGEYKGGLTHDVPKDQFPKGADLHPGLMLMVSGPKGQTPASIKSIEEDKVIIDLNHPTAVDTVVGINHNRVTINLSCDGPKAVTVIPFQQVNSVISHVTIFV